MSVAYPAPCKGWCLPLYIYILISAINILATMYWSKESGALGKLASAMVRTLWFSMYGLVVFLLCLSCQNNYAWLYLVPASLLFGFQMLRLNMRPWATIVPNK